MKIIFYIALFFYTSSSFAQDLTCEDFKNGTFSAIVDDSVAVEYEIIRRGSSQVETLTKIPQDLVDSGYPTDPMKIKIKWLDDCSYILTAYDSDGELNESSKFLNDSGGVFTTLVKIEENCFHYKSSVTIDGKEILSYGRICKINEF